MKLPHVTAIVVAGGSGQRMGAPGGKQLLEIGGIPVLARTLEAVSSCSAVSSVVVVCHPDRVDEYRDAVGHFVVAEKPVEFVAGGDSRQASVSAGIRAVADDETIVAVHDGARPFVTCESIERCVDVVASGRADGAVLAHPVSDTVKVVACGFVEETPDRAKLWAVQTPQVFRASTLRAALDAAERDHYVGTDDASLVERVGGTVAVVEGLRDNIKITHAEDVARAEALLARRTEEGIQE